MSCKKYTIFEGCGVECETLGLCVFTSVSRCEWRIYGERSAWKSAEVSSLLLHIDCQILAPFAALE